MVLFVAGYAGWRDYFQSRRAWFFGIMAAAYAIDLVDTLVKGSAYFRPLGHEYLLRNIAMGALCRVATRTGSEWFHRTFVAVALLYKMSWIYRLYDFIE